MKHNSVYLAFNEFTSNLLSSDQIHRLHCPGCLNGFLLHHTNKWITLIEVECSTLIVYMTIKKKKKKSDEHY